jgi:hypothetical protein
VRWESASALIGGAFRFRSRRVERLLEVDRDRCVALAGDLVDGHEARVLIGVLVAREVGPGHDVLVLRENLDLSILGHHPGEEVPGLSTLRGVLRDPDAVAADERRSTALGSGDPRDADLERSRRQQGCRVGHEADLAVGERGGPGRARLVLRRGENGARGPQVGPGGVDVLGRVAVQERLGAIGVHDLLAVGPDAREPGEDEAAAAVESGRCAIGVRLVERLHRLGVLRELLEVGRAHLGVEACLGDEGLIPEQHREVEHERKHMLLALIGARREVTLVDGVLERHAIDVGGHVLEQTLLHPVRHVHDVGREQVGQAVGAGRRTHLRDVVVVRHDGEFDLVLVAGVVRIDQEVGLLLQGGAGPEGEAGAVVDSLCSSIREAGAFAAAAAAGTAGGQTDQECAGAEGHDGLPQATRVAGCATHAVLLIARR